MRGPKVMITVVILSVLVTLGYVAYATGHYSLAQSANAKNPPMRMLEREMTQGGSAAK